VQRARQLNRDSASWSPSPASRPTASNRPACHYGLGARARRDLGHSALAREHASRAVDIYLSLGLSEAAEARDLLASLG
jgi:hypothetical protein